MVFSDLQAKQFQHGQCLNEILKRFMNRSLIVEITLNKLQYGNAVYCAIDDHIKWLILPNKNYLWPLIIQRF